MDKKGKFYYDGCRDQLEAIEKRVDSVIDVSNFWGTFNTADLIADIKRAIRAAAIGRESETEQ